MRRPLAIAIAIAIVLAAPILPARAAEPVVDLSMRAKAIASSTPVKPASAPFAAGAPLAGGRDPWPEIAMREEREMRGPRGSCEYSTRDVCYDVADARLVYRPARQYMPKIGELTPENVQLRPNRIVLKYSFR
ncbi:MAG TPA: hypothetical protein VHQ02_09330 [Usitatibacter sp.]|nr:hypothetical protein [Usitatibacter sp.]